MNGPANVPHPIPYQGSKRQLVSQILSCFPAGFARLVEPFCGSAAMSLAAAVQRRANNFWLNDGHQPLMVLWQSILQSPNELCAAYSKLWHEQDGNEREYFKLVRERFNREQAPADFLYLLARCVKAAVRYNANGKFNNTPDNRRKGARPAEMERRILGAKELLAGRTRTTSLDYKRVLAKVTDADLVYMDPPYQGVCGERDQRYLPTVSHGEFVEELNVLQKRKCMFIVSYDGRTGDKEFGTALPKSLGLRRIEIQAGRSTQATLLGRSCMTYESLYISSAATKRRTRVRQSTLT